MRFLRPRDQSALRSAALWFVEPLERRLLCSASIANNPMLQFARAGADVNTTNDGALSINYQPPDYTLEYLRGFLSAPEKGNKLAIARTFLAAHAGTYIPGLCRVLPCRAPSVGSIRGPGGAVRSSARMTPAPH